jgi:hypothetical protein
VQEVDHVRAAGDLLLERRGAGGGYGIQTVNRGHREDIDELAIAVGVLGEALAQARHWRR